MNIVSFSPEAADGAVNILERGRASTTPVLAVTASHWSAAQSILAGRSAATVLAAMSPQQPDVLIRAVLVTARRLGVHLTLMFADLSGALAFLDDEACADVDAGRLRLVSLAGAVSRSWSRRVDRLPYSLWDIDRMLLAGIIPIDAVVARVRPGDRPDQVQFGDMVGYTASALETNAKAVFEVLDSAVGSGFRGAQPLSRDRAEILLYGTESTVGRPVARVPTDPVQLEIGRLVASLVPHEATLQLGLGAVPEAVVPQLAGKKSLGLHSGILVPSLCELLANGTITGHSKSRDACLHVATGILDPRGARMADWGEATELRSVRNTHDPATLLNHQRLWAINSALEVDLAGQVNAEFADGLRIASGGGLADFACAAHVSEGGASVIAVPSQTRDGRSRLVARLGARIQPTLQGQAVDFVVTEHGVAALRGLSVWERAQAIIAVAHPTHRQALRRQLQEES